MDQSESVFLSGYSISWDSEQRIEQRIIPSKSYALAVISGDYQDRNEIVHELCYQAGAAGPGKQEFYCVKPVTGRFVTITIPGNRKVLTLCEVLVYGKPAL